MAKKNYPESEEQASKKSASQQQTDQKQGASEIAVDTHQLLNKFNQLIETQNRLLEIQVQRQSSQPVNDEAKKAAEEFNSIVAAIQLKFIPDKPKEFKAVTIASDKIDLSWTETTNNPDGFRLERSDGDSTSNFNEIKRFGPKERSYSDTGLSKKTTYSYRLRAFNIRGESPHVETSATTQVVSAKS